MSENASHPADSRPRRGGAKPRLRRARLLPGLVVLFVFLVAAHASAGVIYVSAAATGANSGASWTDAYVSLPPALAAAASGDEIWVAAGTYKPTATLDRTLSFALKDGVGVYGGFGGSETLRSQRDPAAHVTTLSGDVGTAAASDNSRHVVTAAAGVGPTAVLDGFTITKGNADGAAAPDDRGAGILLSSASPTISNCIVSGNSAGTRGGGARVDGGSASFVACTFQSNFAGTAGGGISAGAVTSLSITRCVIRSNNASDATRGGGIDVANNVAVVGCLVAQNSGNGIEWQDGNSLLDSTVTGHPSYGLAVLAGSSTVANSILWADATGEIFDNGGGAIVSATYSDIAGGFGGTGNVAGDPHFVNPGAGDWRLGAASPAVDSGNNAALPGTLTVDLGGRPRRFDDPAKADSGSGTAPIVDMGAYERIPFSITAPSLVTVCEGAPASFTATATGQPTISYRWRRNTVPIFDGPRISGAATSMVAIDPTAVGDGGNYDVAATDGFGQTVTSSAAMLTVKATPATPSASNDGPVCAGQTLHLTASAVANASYSWTGPNGFTASIQNPTITNASQAASGTYSVTATVNGCVSAAGSTSATVGPACVPVAAGTLLPDGRATDGTLAAPGNLYRSKALAARSYSVEIDVPRSGAGTVGSGGPAPALAVLRADGTTAVASALREACAPATSARRSFTPSVADVAGGPLVLSVTDSSASGYSFRIRLEETSMFCPRWSVNGYSALAVVQNTSSCMVSGQILLFDSSGAQLTAVPFALAAGASVQVGLPTGLPAVVGAAVLTHDGPAGAVAAGVYMTQAGGSGGANFRWPFLEARSTGSSDGR